MKLGWYLYFSEVRPEAWQFEKSLRRRWEFGMIPNLIISRHIKKLRCRSGKSGIFIHQKPPSNVKISQRLEIENA